MGRPPQPRENDEPSLQPEPRLCLAVRNVLLELEAWYWERTKQQQKTPPPPPPHRPETLHPQRPPRARHHHGMEVLKTKNWLFFYVNFRSCLGRCGLF